MRAPQRISPTPALRCLLTAALLAGSGFAEARAEAPDKAEKATIRVTGYTPWAWNALTRARRSALQDWLATERDPVTGQLWGDLIKLAPDNQLSFPGFSLKLLNFAAGTGEEVITTPDVGVQDFFRYRDQRFLLPLNPFIWEIRADGAGKPLRTADGAWDYVLDGQGERVLLWPDWERVPAAFREIVTSNGDVFGLPIQRTGVGLMYRRDMFERAGLDPDAPPRDWDELFDVALRISATEEGNSRKYGLMLTGDFVELYTLGDGGESARMEKYPDGSTRWVADFASPERLAALRFVRRSTLTKWIVTPDGSPLIVWEPDRETQPVIEHPSLGVGRWEGEPGRPGSQLVFPGATYGPAQIRTGVAFNQLGGYGVGNDDKWYNLFSEPDGRLAMSVQTPAAMIQQLQALDPTQVGFGPVPRGKAGAFVRAEGQIGSLNYILADDPTRARLSWAVLSFLASRSYERMSVHSYVREGEGVADTLDPRLLVEEGYETITEQMSPSMKAYWEGLEASTKAPIIARNFQTLSDQYLQPIYRRASLEPDYDYLTAIAKAEEQVQKRLDFQMGAYERVEGRGWIITAIVVIFAAVIIFSWVAFRSLSQRYDSALHQPAKSREARRRTLTAYALLAPGMILILVFSYYPIIISLPIAFQDYYVVGESEWIGIANFVEVFSNPVTWISLMKAIYYLGLTVAVGFLAPVVLAILLSETFSVRYLLRTIYYLPAVVAGIVMLLMWRRFFEATPEGMVNRLVMPLMELWNKVAPGIRWDIAVEPIDWLHHPVLGIPSIVFVGIWGGMGPGMLIYLAALKSVPEELYEAAELDGAGWWSRFSQITLSYLRPLLVINFVGAVIGAFQASGNILALSGNFPATYTFAVHIWFEAFGLGQFGVGTALSWVMAALLVGFTVWQLRILRDVEFRKAAAD